MLPPPFGLSNILVTLSEDLEELTRSYETRRTQLNNLLAFYASDTHSINSNKMNTMHAGNESEFFVCHVHIPCYLHIYVTNNWAHIYTYMHACMHAYIHSCTHTEYIHKYATFIHTYIHTYTCIHACIHINIHIHTCIIEPVPWWNLTHLSMHTYIHTYLFTFLFNSFFIFLIPVYVWADDFLESSHTLIRQPKKKSVTVSETKSFLEDDNNRIYSYL